MKKKKTTNILLMILVCIILSACGQEKVTSDTEEPDFAVDGESREEDQEQEKVTSDIEEPDSAVGGESCEDVQTREIAIIPAEKADIPIKANESGRALTAEELQLFDEFIQESCNYGFLLSVYDTPADANLNEIFYDGLGVDQEGITEDEIQAYMDETGDEAFLDFNKITATQLNDFLLERTGLSYDQMNTRLVGWTYLPEYDAYYWQHGDTNIRFFNCEEGYTVDEKLFVLRVAAENYGYEDGYHDMRYELVLEKNGETYQFKSNRLMIEEGLIADQSFQVSLSPIGDVIFASYEPNTEEIPLADVSFSIIKDGWEITQLHGAEYSINIRETDVFNEIEDIAFADYDEDGIADIIMILNYSPVSDADASYSEVRVYKGDYHDYSYGDYYYFQRYQLEISETLTAELPEKTISAVLDHLATILPDTNAD